MIGWFSLAAIEWSYVLGSTPLEVTATVCSVLGVFLIARQNVWGWPLAYVHTCRRQLEKVPAPGNSGGMPVAPVNRLAMLVDRISPRAAWTS